MSLRINSLFWLLLPIILLSCQKEKRTVSWEQITVDRSGHLNKIAFDQIGNGYIVGGSDWLAGVLGTTSDGGESWTFDSLTNKRLYDLHIDEEQNVYAVGVDGYLFTKAIDGDWKFHRLPDWNINRGVAYRSDGFGVIGSGAAFGNGLINTFENESEKVEQFDLDFEISDVAISSDSSLHAVGYGVILRSTDDGNSWQWADIDEDFFQAIQFVNDQLAFVIGFSGSILKSTDAGVSWEYLRRADRAAVQDKPFRDLHFINSSKGFICGEEGLIWYTEDGGASWSIIEGLPEENYLSVSSFGDQGFLVGENEVLIRFDLP